MSELILIAVVVFCWMFSIVIFCTGVHMHKLDCTEYAYWCYGVSVSLMIVWIVTATMWG